MIQILIDDGMIDFATVDRLFGHRVCRLVNSEFVNKRILYGKKGLWNDFERLAETLKARGTAYRASQLLTQKKQKNFLLRLMN